MKHFYIKELGNITDKELRTFECVATGMDTISSKKIAESLMLKGYIEQCGEKILCKDRFGTVTVPRYGVPLDVHMRWCAWCAEQQVKS